MPAETIGAGAQISINGVQRVKLSNASAKPADVEITDDGTHINRRIDAGGDVTEELHGNPVTITNKSKVAVLAEW